MICRGLEWNSAGGVFVCEKDLVNMAGRAGSVGDRIKGVSGVEEDASVSIIDGIYFCFSL